jgi:ATP-dependent helicase/nuclease subunit A
MTIHKSKGLEFPYVILANCGKAFNFLDTKEPLLVSREAGVGLKIRDDKKFTKYNTLSSLANDKALKIGEVSEELRILYVALTRAKENLIFMCSINAKTSLERISAPLYVYDEAGKRSFNPFSVFKYQNYSEWICSALVFHESAKPLREYLGMTTTEKLDNSFSLNIFIETACALDETEEEKEEKWAEVNHDLLEKIKERAEYVYPYDELSTVLAKINASSVEKHIARREFFASKKPKFIDEKTTGAKRGTVIHKFLELCDFKNAYENFEGEISRLLSEFKLTEDEISVIDKLDIEKFFNEDVGKRLLKSNDVYKEYEFSVLKNAGEFYPELPEDLKNEKIVVQGKFDCAFIESDGAVLIDYKTDKITDEETLVSIYEGQLDVYKAALEECIEIPVKEIYIYSFKIGKFIKI